MLWKTKTGISPRSLVGAGRGHEGRIAAAEKVARLEARLGGVVPEPGAGAWQARHHTSSSGSATCQYLAERGAEHADGGGRPARARRRARSTSALSSLWSGHLRCACSARRSAISCARLAQTSRTARRYSPPDPESSM